MFLIRGFPRIIAPETLRGSSGLSQLSNSRRLSKPRQTRPRTSGKQVRRFSISSTEDKNMQSAYRGSRLAERKQSRIKPREGVPWSREERNLLKTLRKDRNLPWTEFARCFTKQFACLIPFITREQEAKLRTLIHIIHQRHAKKGECSFNTRLQKHSRMVIQLSFIRCITILFDSGFLSSSGKFCAMFEPLIKPAALKFGIAQLCNQ